MKITLTTFMLVIGLLSHLNAQTTKTNYIGLNLPPMLGTALEIGFERTIKPNFSVDLYTGYVFNSRLDSPLKKGSLFDVYKKSGFFLKLGARYNFRKDLSKFAPFVGLNIVNSIALEEGTFIGEETPSTPYPDPIVNNSYNLGISGIVGVTSPSDKKLNVDVGFQFGRIFIDNLLDFHSYMPGMGVNYGARLRLQGIVRIKYRLNKVPRATTPVMENDAS
jgi:outer membrane protein W